MNKKKNSSGFTLVEALVGGTLFSICAIILVTGFIASLILIRKGTEIKNKGLEISSVVDGAVNSNPSITETSVPDGVLSYQINTTQYQINGSYNDVYETEEDIGFIVFISDTP